MELKDGEGTSSEEEENSDSDESSSDEDRKPKGVSGLIEIENPNRVSKKPSAAISSNSSSSAGAPTGLANGGKVELSRREREEIEKQRAKERYDKLHAAGKTDQAKADLARLALIREKREQEAAKRREENRVREEDSKKKMQASGRKTTSDSGPSSSKK